MRKFYKTRIVVEVLSEYPLANEISSPRCLADLKHAVTDGDCSGDITKVEEEILTPLQAAQALLSQGSDPSFFQLTENGEDIES